MKGPFSVIAFRVYVVLVGVSLFSCSSSPPQIEEADLKFTISVLGEQEQETPLEFSWELENRGTKPIFVYSSLLTHPAFAPISASRTQRTINVTFTRLDPFPHGISPPLVFPEAEFLMVPPSGKKVGVFRSVRDIRDEYPELTDGEWQVTATIGIGFEESSVKKEVARVLVGGQEHPLNPIIKWQRLVHSQPVQTRIRKSQLEGRQ